MTHGLTFGVRDCRGANFVQRGVLITRLRDVRVCKTHPDGVDTVTPELVTPGETMVRLLSPRGGRLETSDTLRFSTAGAESNVAIAALGS